MSWKSWLAEAKYCIAMSRALSVCEYLCVPGRECIHDGCPCFMRGLNGRNYCALELVLEAVRQKGVEADEDEP